MNILLLSADDFISDTRAIIRDKRVSHVINVLTLQPGDLLKAGVQDGDIGTAKIETLDNDQLEIEFTPLKPPPAPLPLTLIVALPRPKMIRRILRTCAEQGVKEIIFINSYKVEKSYWQSPALAPDKVKQYFVDGLEQSIDTTIPILSCYKRFKPFVEDDLPAILAKRPGILAHPGVERSLPHPLNRPTTLVIGPEGGFTPYEVEKLVAAGCEVASLGDRILRVENAVIHCISRLYTV